MTHPHHAGDGCTAAVAAAHKDLAEQIQRVAPPAAAGYRGSARAARRSSAGGIGFQAERAETLYEARPQVDLRSAL